MFQISITRFTVNFNSFSLFYFSDYVFEKLNLFCSWCSFSYCVTNRICLHEIKRKQNVDLHLTFLVYK